MVIKFWASKLWYMFEYLNKSFHHSSRTLNRETYIPIQIQQDATLHNLFISGNCSTCFGCYFHPSSGGYTPVFTASSICHTVTVGMVVWGMDGNEILGLKTLVNI